MNSKRIAIAGHAGIGHVHGYGGFIQDDSAGFITVASMVRDILQANTLIKEIQADPFTNTIEVITVDGGTSMSSPRRGITPSEAKIINKLTGEDALYCQELVVNALGRMYGQGILETTVSLQGALANSVVDTFRKKSPGKFKVTEESIETNCGLIGGMKTSINGTDISMLLSVNQTKSGIGPVEDLEGNITLGSKQEIMKDLDMLKCPTIVVESKAYLPAISGQLSQNTYLIRAQKDIDNIVVAKDLHSSARELGYQVMFRDDLMPYKKNFIREQTSEFVNKMKNHLDKLNESEMASEKTLITAEIAKMVSQDAGGITCLSNKINDVFRGPGVIPGTSAVISLVVTKKHQDYWKIPLYDESDVGRTKKIIACAVEKLSNHLDEAYECIEKYYVTLEVLE